MARSTPFSPNSNNVDMPSPILISPNTERPETIGQIHSMLDHTRPSPYATRPLFQRSNSMRMLPACPYPVATPRSPELTLTPEGNHHILQPVKLNFSPISQNNQAPEEHTPIYGLMHHNTQALRESPRLISSVDAIYCSTILQENINHLLADHALDVTKTRQTARYLGIKEEVFFTYIRETYPKHYWAQLGNKQ